ELPSNYPKDVEFSSYLDVNYIYNLELDNIEFREEVNNLSFPKRWKEEGVNPPNIECKKNSVDLLNKIFLDYKIKPKRIAPTIEEGIMLYYYNLKNKKELYIELYNDMTKGGIINRKKKILISEDFNHYNDDNFKLLITEFFK
ncbi:MAG: hypothetical protein OEZ36_11235, partial [Spirochaetota bacterium]|nr:hypothetical protein [Spirochaetota bacterium]